MENPLQNSSQPRATAYEFTFSLSHHRLVIADKRTCQSMTHVRLCLHVKRFSAGSHRACGISKLVAGVPLASRDHSLCGQVRFPTLPFPSSHVDAAGHRLPQTLGAAHFWVFGLSSTSSTACTSPNPPSTVNASCSVATGDRRQRSLSQDCGRQCR